ncbi:MAG: tetratricopeptide repeat protein, partial [Planctomycetes bacterium]|nr:tetratricopeptide repeat protein [Planctomycetota bacterium]
MTNSLRATALACLCAIVLGCQSPLLTRSEPRSGLDPLGPLRNWREGRPTERSAGGPGEAESFHNPEHDLALGREADRAGRYEEAKRLYHRVLEVQPDHPEAHHALAVVADKQADYRTAEAHYLQALRQKTSSANLLSDLGYSYFLQARRGDAERYLREALRHDAAHAKARGNLELLYDYDKALETYRLSGSEADAQARALALFPQGPPQAAAFAGPTATGSWGSAPAVHGAQPPAAAFYGNPPQVGEESPVMRQLREQMDRERQFALAARQHSVNENASQTAWQGAPAAGSWNAPQTPADWNGQTAPAQAHWNPAPPHSNPAPPVQPAPPHSNPAPPVQPALPVQPTPQAFPGSASYVNGSQYAPPPAWNGGGSAG